MPQAQLEKYIENPESLYVIKEAKAEALQPGQFMEDQGAEMSVLKFDEDMCFDEVPQRYPSPNPDKILLDGPKCPF